MARVPLPLSGLVGFPGLQRVVGSRYAAQGCVYGDAPFLKQPFWDIEPIPVLLAPGAELTRGGIRPCRELQMSRPHFKFSRQGEQRRNGTPPIGVFALARRSGENRRCRHRPRSYSDWADTAAESSHEWRM